MDGFHVTITTYQEPSRHLLLTLNRYHTLFWGLQVNDGWEALSLNFDGILKYHCNGQIISP